MRRPSRQRSQRTTRQSASWGPSPIARRAFGSLQRNSAREVAWAACYEAGPKGYALYWQLTKLGVPCVVIAPTLVPTKAGDRVKTDRRDAERLASRFRAGELTPVWVPDAPHEAMRDLVRAREAAKQDQLRARHRLGNFLLRHSKRPPTANAHMDTGLRCLDQTGSDV